MPRPTAGGLALIGPRGTGKTTVGRLVAGATGRPFVDADRALEGRAGRSIAAIFAQAGEPAFRDLEEATLRDLVGRAGAVLATGGGVVLREVNRDALRRFGFVVWLTADPAALADRLARDPADRPSLTGLGTIAEVAAVLEARAPLYRATADAVVATDGLDPEAVARKVLDAWREGGLAP
ncbi:MAG TPA: shikimate kinase [Isosphaeraceae bacterium]|jgi:shikimate kinase|nr:shikimate kinase [Isosphaeraceae bacterium]